VTVESRIFAPGLLDEQVVLVTGGGTGLGKATAAELVACGAQVVIAGRRADVIDATAADLGERCFALQGDVRDPAEAERIVAAILERHGRLDTLVNNAGGQYFSPAEMIEPKGFAAVMNLNVDGTYAMCQAAFHGAMRPAGRGTIVNVTLSPHNGMPGMVHSGAARAAVEAITRELAAEWEADGVVVVAAAAGHYDTESLRKYPPQVWQGAARSVPLQRLGREEEHAWLVAMLASPLGRAFNGTAVTLDGGRDNWYGAWPPQGLPDETGHVPQEERRSAPITGRR
jgi:citronellol/citronellal dehydrogenase